MSILQFSHANGFPAGSYRFFFECLEPLKVHAINGLGVPHFRASQGWNHLADELIKEIEKKQEPVIGIGHSFGAVVTLIAAGKRSDLFEKVLLIDPPLLPFNMRMAIFLSGFLGFSNLVPILKKAKSRRTEFSNREEARNYFGSKSLFRNFHPQCFEDYIQAGLTPNISGDGVTLTIPSKIEYEVFKSTPVILPPPPQVVPTHFLLSDAGELLQEKDILSLKKKYPQAAFDLFPGGHLFPLEKPKKTAAWIQNWVAKS